MFGPTGSEKGPADWPRLLFLNINVLEVMFT